LALIYGVSRWATAPEWVPVLSGLSIETVGAVTDKLDQAAIKYKLERGGTDVSVAASDLARARVTIARDGLPTAGRPGLELFDQPSWSMTDFTQRINYRRALEGELERTIGKMRGVEVAQVHLADARDIELPLGQHADRGVRRAQGSRPDAVARGRGWHSASGGVERRRVGARARDHRR
jgi:flagellar M-ring protein FliF